MYIQAQLLLTLFKAERAQQFSKSHDILHQKMKTATSYLSNGEWSGQLLKITAETYEKSPVTQASAHPEEESTSAVPCVIHYPFSTSVVTDVGRDPAAEAFLTAQYWHSLRGHGYHFVGEK